MNSTELRALITQLEAAAANSGATLLDAEHQHKLAVRSALLSYDNTHADETLLSVEASRSAYRASVMRLEEARQLLSIALESEKNQRFNQLRAEIETRCSQIEETAVKADDLFRQAIEALQACRELEASTICLIQKDYSDRAPLGRQLTQTLSDASAKFRTAFSQGGAPDLSDIVSTRSRDAVAAIKRSMGIQQ